MEIRYRFPAVSPDDQRTRPTPTLDAQWNHCLGLVLLFCRWRFWQPRGISGVMTCPWQEIKKHVEEATGETFNSVLCNRYRTKCTKYTKWFPGEPDQRRTFFGCFLVLLGMEATLLDGILTEIFITIQSFFVGLKVEVKNFHASCCHEADESDGILQTIVMTRAMRHCKACWQRIDLWSKADHCIRHLAALAHHVAPIDAKNLKWWFHGTQKSWTKVTLGAERDFDMREGQAAVLSLSTGCWKRHVARQRWSGEVRICIVELQVDWMRAESHVAWRSQKNHCRLGDWLLKHRKTLISVYRNNCFSLGARLRIRLKHGSLLALVSGCVSLKRKCTEILPHERYKVMSGATQDRWQHSLPRRKALKEWARSQQFIKTLVESTGKTCEEDQDHLAITQIDFKLQTTPSLTVVCLRTNASTWPFGVLCGEKGSKAAAFFLSSFLYHLWTKVICLLNLLPLLFCLDSAWWF